MTSAETSERLQQKLVHAVEKRLDKDAVGIADKKPQLDMQKKTVGRMMSVICLQWQGPPSIGECKNYLVN